MNASDVLNDPAGAANAPTPAAAPAGAAPDAAAGPQPATVAAQAPHGWTALAQLGVIRAHGEEAAKFLHGQLTQDLALMPVGAPWRLAAWCNAKGRMVASFWVARPAADEVLLVTPRDTLAATLKRLGLFVLRAKLRLTDASADWTVLGGIGIATENIATSLENTCRSTVFEGVSKPLLHALPAVLGVTRTLALCPGQPTAALADAPRLAWWHWLEVMGGVAQVQAATAEAFVPQMLNYESAGGVNFKKGCYPGQEVVARSQFRGTLKRRAYLAHSLAPLHAGQAVFSSAEPSEPCGLVAQAAPQPPQEGAQSSGHDNRASSGSKSHDSLVRVDPGSTGPGNAGAFHAIVCLSVAHAQATQQGRAGLHLQAADGPPLTLLALPYALVADV